jgi:hypothetical protein
MKKLLNKISLLFDELPLSCIAGMSLFFLIGAVIGCLSSVNICNNESVSEFFNESISLSKTDYYVGLRFVQAVIMLTSTMP